MHEIDHTTENTPQQNVYQTGDTRQPKNYRSVIALLLMAVIVLGSLVSVLSLMNIHLFRQLQAKDSTPPAVSFVSGDTGATEGRAIYAQVRFSSLGITCSMPTNFDRHYYGLPEGIYITHVEEASNAHKQGICAGDILLSLGANRITDTDSLENYLNLYKPGETVKLVIYRDGKEYLYNITLE